ncbi:MAG: tRNA epoxyqueuosine(34) reductase QueG, partial [Planctomycetota bacterium]
MAQDLGFAEIGWTTGNSQGAKEAFIRWLAEGRHGPLAYMDNHKELRLHPERLLEVPAAGFLVVVLPLARVETKAADLPPGHAYVSRYARGRDYHRLMRHRLVKLLDEIKRTQPRIEGRAIVDSAPVLERDLAVQAGLGWIGKNSMFLTPQWGSHVLLGSLILSEKPEDLEPRQALADHCGSCRACLEACPTGAIQEGELMDASQCIVCWSIEEKTLPDVSKVQKWGSHFFGCDLCQDPCPWNRFADAPVEG